MASGIGKEISETTRKLGKLAQCMFLSFTSALFDVNVVAKRKTLFDDRPVEISVSFPRISIPSTKCRLCLP